MAQHGKGGTAGPSRKPFNKKGGHNGKHERGGSPQKGLTQEGFKAGGVKKGTRPEKDGPKKRSRDFVPRQRPSESEGGIDVVMGLIAACSTCRRPPPCSHFDTQQDAIMHDSPPPPPANFVVDELGDAVMFDSDGEPLCLYENEPGRQGIIWRHNYRELVRMNEQTRVELERLRRLLDMDATFQHEGDAAQGRRQNTQDRIERDFEINLADLQEKLVDDGWIIAQLRKQSQNNKAPWNRDTYANGRKRQNDRQGSIHKPGGHNRDSRSKRPGGNLADRHNNSHNNGSNNGHNNGQNKGHKTQGRNSGPGNANQGHRRSSID